MPLLKRTTKSANATSSSAEEQEVETKRWFHLKATSPNKSNRKGSVLSCAVVLMTCFTLWNGLRTMILPNDFLEQNNAPSFAIKASHSQRTGSSMAACLLIKDDNHHLIEWIAYHYLVLPLRHLVIAVDPDSLTSPLSIINRWKNAANVDIEIALWNDEDYMNHTTLESNLNRKLSALQLQNPKQELIELHRIRQGIFASQCSFYHKSKGRTWVAHVDTDEFILFNYLHNDERQFLNISESDYRPDSLREKLPPLGTQTIADFLEQVQNGTEWRQKGCIGMARLRFGSLDGKDEHPFSKLDLPGIDHKMLNTMQQFYHSQVGSHKTSGNHKVILDASKASGGLLLDGYVNIHFPSRVMCPPATLKPEIHAGSFLRVHHYLGTWEQFRARVDVRRGPGFFHKQALADSKYGPNYDIAPWLQKFVQLVGIETAQYLLKGAGEIEGTLEDYVLASQPSCALLFYGDIERVDETALWLLRQNILDANPSCDVFVHSYTGTEAVRNGVADETSQQSGAAAKVKAFKEQQSNRVSSYEEQLETTKEFQRKRYDTYGYFQRVIPTLSVSAGNMIRQLHSVESVWQLMESHEKKKLKRFDRVGLFGFDVRCTSPINITTKEPAVIVAPSGQEQAIPDNCQAFYGFRDVVEVCALDPFRSAQDYLLWWNAKGENEDSSEWRLEAFLKYVLVEKWSLDAKVKVAC